MASGECAMNLSGCNRKPIVAYLIVPFWQIHTRKKPMEASEKPGKPLLARILLRPKYLPNGCSARFCCLNQLSLSIKSKCPPPPTAFVHCVFNMIHVSCRTKSVVT